MPSGVNFDIDSPLRFEVRKQEFKFDKNWHPPCETWTATKQGWRQLVNPQVFLCHTNFEGRHRVVELRERDDTSIAPGG